MESFTDSEILGVREEPRISGISIFILIFYFYFNLLILLSIIILSIRATIWKFSKRRKYG